MSDGLAIFENHSFRKEVLANSTVSIRAHPEFQTLGIILPKKGGNDDIPVSLPSPFSLGNAINVRFCYPSKFKSIFGYQGLRHVPDTTGSPLKTLAISLCQFSVLELDD